MSTYFWYATGILTGLAAALVALPLLRLRETHARAFRYGSISLVVLAFAALAAILYHVLGRPDLINQQAPATAQLPHAGARAPAPGAEAGTLEDATNRLAERLARDGGNAEDWQLLAQSYEMLGRTDEAARAREHVADAKPAAPAAQVASDSGSVEALEKQVKANPRDASAWRSLATLYRRQRDFPKAQAAFKQLVALKAMDADTWADYADVLATGSGGSLKGEPAKAIDRALALDSNHTKALWLKASLAFEQQRYADSLAVWQKLRANLPAGSPDVPIIEANIAEAASLANVPAAVSASAAKPAPVQVSGTVSIDKQLAARVAPGATLFIYAKAVDSPGPPLAVLRTSPTSWPVNFRLDDTLAMMPNRKLSDFSRVIVTARVSSSGQATPAPGDLYIESPVVQPADSKQLQLVISRVIS